MTLNDIRKKSGLLILVIGVAMLGFILTDLMNSGSSLFQKEQNILLEIDDIDVTFTNFEKELENSLNIKFMSNFGTVNVTDQQRTSERNLLWDQKIKEIILEEKFDQSGVTVSKSEIWDMISGEIHNGQAQLFSFFFREQTENGEWNQYTPDLIDDWISMGTDNPQWPRYLYFKDNTVRDRAFEKYYTAVKKGVNSTTIDAKSYYEDQTKSIDGKFIYIPCLLTEDETFNPSEDEIKNFYKKNKSKYSNIPSRELTYFIFNLEPSDNDKSIIQKEMSDLILDREIYNKKTSQKELQLGFQNSDNLNNFINEFGDNRYSEIKMSLIDLGEKYLNNYNFENGIGGAGTIIKPFFEDGFCKMGRVISSNSDSVTIVFLERELYASDETLNEIYSQVYDFIENNNQSQSIDEVLEKTKLRPRVVSLEKMDESVSGLGSSRQVVRWLFDENTQLNEAKFFDFQNKYVVAFLSNISEEETKDFNDVYSDIFNELYVRNKSFSIVEKINNSKYESIEDLSRELNYPLKKASQLKINQNSIGDLSVDPGVIGSFFSSQIDQVSKPYISQSGVFVFYKTKESKLNFPTNLDRYKSVIERTHHQDIDEQLIESLKSDKKIKDNRFNFY
ncbi:MAG: hypothetical protein CMP65_03875 [Flavobacteriales bacterium]|nr:hypothetical protein [Flavobacteriales bacterium]|tara:strand:- start:11502 stop:13355 length:1854 start_codon:yes stop_codon:yes gene_type:complete